MRLKHSYIIFILAFAGLLMSCTEETQEFIVPDIDYGYFPFDTGMWIDYKVMEIDIDADIDKYDTTQYLLREYFQEYFTDNAGDESILIKRYARNNEQANWTIKDNWYATLYNNAAHRIEENVRFVKMTFPVQQEASWNGNAFNIYSQDNHPQYSFTSVDIPYTINTFEFDSVVEITQYDKLSVVDKIYKTEKYAKHIGLIEKQSIDVYSDITDTSINIMDRITIGTIYIQEIIAYGQQ